MAISELAPTRKPSLSPSELDDAGALVAEAHWNQLAADWRIFIAQGRVYAVQTAQGRIVATAATLPYGGRFAWISMVLVAGEYRRRGLATELMRRAVDDLTAAGLVPILDATPDGREVYRQLGFTDSWGFQRLVRREARAATFPSPAGVVIRPLTDADWPALAAYDAAATRDGRVVGFALGRDGRLAAQIGPLTADNDDIACALAARALDRLDGPVFVDLADAKSALRSYLDARGFTVARPFTRMLYGASTRFDDAARTYAVVGPEFG